MLRRLFRTRFRRAVLLLSVLLLAAWLFRATLLAALANAWVVDEPLVKSDAILVLGGGEQTRPQRAAALFHEGYAPLVLIVQPRLRATDKLGLTPSPGETNRRVLIQAGVPEPDITALPGEVTSTRDEAAALKSWGLSHPGARVIIVTDAFHTRRARWIFRRTLVPGQPKVIITGVPPQDFTLETWWQHEDGVLAFQNELLKMLFYFVHY